MAHQSNSQTSSAATAAAGNGRTGCNKVYLILRQVILFSEDFVQRPEAHLLDVPQLAMPVEVVLGMLPSSTHALGHAPQQLYKQRQMILIPARRV